ncbi:hypothetical protein DH2020_002345 [Rehmannia glutinosa]|uniref:Uncharacterized protein n=1 Tax=Rehmannia glutinosa TaxID=99300 RepID=A0ABR0XTQ0_REHGL
MSFSDSEYSSQGAEYKTFRQISRDRLLYEMLQQSKSGDSRSSWKVLIMDKVTLKVMSHSCKMADITDQGVSLVEDLFRRREPLPSMDAIYFIQPSKEKAYVYFSSPVPKDLLTRIKNDTSVLPRIGALREMNLEYFSIDSQGFVTDHERALEELFGDNAENSRRFDACLNVMAMRIATVFASLKEFPFVRYRAAKGLDGATAATGRDLVPMKLAQAVWNNISTYKSSIPNFPSTETCELLIVDRSVDKIAPVIHEWTYDAMCHDLLDLDGNKYVQEASERLHDKMTNFVSKNKAAQLQQRDGSELSTRDLQKMVQALPQYNEQMEKLSLHVEIAGKINTIIRESGLRELGQLEQDLVFGDAGTKEVITFLRSKQEGMCENKLRLLMIYACVYPEKFEGDKAIKLMQEQGMGIEMRSEFSNILLIRGSMQKEKIELERKRHGHYLGIVTWFRSQELIENLSKGELPKDEYQCMNNASPSNHGTQGSSGAPQAPPSVRTGSSAAPHSMRSRRTAAWARPRASDDGYSSDSVLRSASSDFRKMGQRIFVFIIGGATRSESINSVLSSHVVSETQALV